MIFYYIDLLLTIVIENSILIFGITVALVINNLDFIYILVLTLLLLGLPF